MAKAPVMRKNRYRPPPLGAQHRENHGPMPSSLLQIPKALAAHLTSFHMRNEDISPKKGGRLRPRGYPGSGRSCLGSSSSKQMDNLYVFSHLEHTRRIGNGEVCNLGTMDTEAESATSSAWPRSEFQASYKYTVRLPLPFNCLTPYILVGVLKTL